VKGGGYEHSEGLLETRRGPDIVLGPHKVLTHFAHEFGVMGCGDTGSSPPGKVAHKQPPQGVRCMPRDPKARGQHTKPKQQAHHGILATQPA
jgi:hypothetical protein